MSVAQNFVDELNSLLPKHESVLRRLFSAKAECDYKVDEYIRPLYYRRNICELSVLRLLNGLLEAADDGRISMIFDKGKLTRFVCGQNAKEMKDKLCPGH